MHTKSPKWVLFLEITYSMDCDMIWYDMIWYDLRLHLIYNYSESANCSMLKPVNMVTPTILSARFLNSIATVSFCTGSLTLALSQSQDMNCGYNSLRSRSHSLCSFEFEYWQNATLCKVDLLMCSLTQFEWKLSIMRIIWMNTGSTWIV